LAENGFEPGEVLGLASGLVKASAELKPAVDLVLGRAWVVRSRKTAEGLMQQLRNQTDGAPADARAVTLRGEVFFANGAVIAGQEGKPGTLSRPRPGSTRLRPAAGQPAQRG
jgi:chromosome segregation ATPase